MNIIVRRKSGHSCEVIGGHHRLRATLQVFGKAMVIDAESGESFEVHEVEGEMVAMERDGQAATELAARQALERAAKR